MYALKQNSKVNEMKGKYSNRNTNKKWIKKELLTNTPTK